MEGPDAAYIQETGKAYISLVGKYQGKTPLWYPWDR
jgi:hypothetical protein